MKLPPLGGGVLWLVKQYIFPPTWEYHFMSSCFWEWFRKKLQHQSKIEWYFFCDQVSDLLFLLWTHCHLIFVSQISVRACNATLCPNQRGMTNGMSDTKTYFLGQVIIGYAMAESWMKILKPLTILKGILKVWIITSRKFNSVSL